MSDRIVLAPYDQVWPDQFEAERALLEQVLRPWLEGGIHHIGSTAIPNMRAKPVIDMMAGVRDLEEARAAFEPPVGTVTSSHRIAHTKRTTSISRRRACRRRHTACI